MSALSDWLDEPTIVRGGGRPERYEGDTGRRMPSVTTVGGMLDKPGLVYWANNHGLEGRDLRAAREFESATDIGSYVHDCVHADIHGDEFPTFPEHLAARQDAVDSALNAWRRWREGSGLTFIATEVPFVSEQYAYGGTIDAVVRDEQGRLAIADWKTSKGIYKDYLIQVAAYAMLWDENNAESITGGYHIVRFSKEHGDMEYRHFPELEDGKRAFVLLRELYDLVKALEKRAK